MAQSSLTQTLVADGDTAVIDWPGGPGLLAIAYQAGTGTITLKFSLDAGATYLPWATTITAAGAKYLEFKLPQCKLKATLSSGSTPDIDVAIRAL